MLTEFEVRERTLFEWRGLRVRIESWPAARILSVKFGEAGEIAFSRWFRDDRG